MATEIKWTTGKGTAVVLTLVTSRTVSDEGAYPVEIPAYELTCQAGDHYVTSPVVVEHPVYGTALKAHYGRNGVRYLVVPVVAEVVDEVRALVNEYHAEVALRAATAAGEIEQYETSRARTLRAMAE